MAKARRKDSLRALAKLTYNVAGEPRNGERHPPLVIPLGEMSGAG